MDFAYTVSSTNFYLGHRHLKRVKTAEAETLASDKRVDRVGCAELLWTPIIVF